MKILLCNYEHPPLGGGGGVFTAMLADELAKRHEVTLLTSGSPRQTQENGVRILKVPPLFRKRHEVSSGASMAAYLSLALPVGMSLLRRERFDLVSTHFALPTGPVGQMLARYQNIPNVLSVYGGDLYDPSKWTSPHRHFPLRLMIRRLIQTADAVVSPSDDIQNKLWQFYGLRNVSHRIPLGIRFPQIRAGVRESYGLGKSCFVMTTIGRLVKRKKTEDLFFILRSLGCADTRLFVVGSGPQEKELRHLAKELGLENQVIFAGHVSEEEKFKILSISDLFVSTSCHEGFGLVFLEAMACALPIICYSGGGQNDIITDGAEGFLVGKSNMAFHCRVQELIRDEDMRLRMGRQSKAKAEEFSIGRTASQYCALFDQILAKARERKTSVRHCRHYRHESRV